MHNRWTTPIRHSLDRSPIGGTVARTRRQLSIRQVIWWQSMKQTTVSAVNRNMKSARYLTKVSETEMIDTACERMESALSPTRDGRTILRLFF